MKDRPSNLSRCAQVNEMKFFYQEYANVNHLDAVLRLIIHKKYFLCLYKLVRFRKSPKKDAQLHDC